MTVATVITSFPGGLCPRTPPRSASGAPAGTFRQQSQQLGEQPRRTLSFRALGSNLRPLLGPR
eukprot:14700537-Alexandrium_andersonii.AAC.1